MKRTLIVAAIISLLILATGITYSWLSFTDEYPLVEIESGSLLVDSNVSGDTLTNSVELNSLMYIDFYEDIITDKTNTLNLVATSITVTITGQAETIDFKNEIELNFPTNQDDLVYLIINEGLNVGVNPLTTDYHTYMENLVSVGNTDETDWRNAIDSNNQTILNNIKNTNLSENDTLTLQIVFWGDYNNLTDNTTYLDTTYSVDLVINSVQVDKEWS